MKSIVLALGLFGAWSAAQADSIVFSTDFDGAMPAEIMAGTASLTGVQGYAGYGVAGNQFGGNFLRSMTANVVTLTLNDLPDHSTISLAFLFAAIDSLDGTGTFPAGDYFRIELDGVQIFRESFANAMESQIQSYLPPAGVQLARRVDLGFSGPGSFYTDSAYDLGADPVFSNIAHTGSTATFKFVIEGEGIQNLDDESWAMDNLRVSVNAVPAPATAWLFLPGLAGMIRFARTRKPAPGGEHPGCGRTRAS